MVKIKPKGHDNFIAANRINEVTGYHLSFNMEVLQGCAFTCKGCGVEKYLSEPINDNYHKKIITFLDSAKAKGYHRSLVFINPTDFLVSDNIAEVLDDKNIIDICNRFKRLSIQTTAINIDKAEEVGKYLRKNFGNMELEVNILLEPDKIYSDLYLGRIKKNRDEMYKIFDWNTGIRSFCIMNVFEYEKNKKLSVSPALGDYSIFHERIKHMFSTSIDFNFSLTRKPDVKTEDIKDAILRVTSLMRAGVDGYNKQFLRFAFGKLTDYHIGKFINFLNGSFYIAPLLYDRYAAFTPQLRIPFKDYTVEELESFESSLILEQYENIYSKEQCAECEFLNNCTERYIPKLMDIYGIKECVAAKDALRELNLLPD